MTSAPWLAQVRAQVQSVRKTLPEARAVAIRLSAADGAAPAPAALRIGAEELPLFRADSVLALRERLVDLPDGGPPLVVLTDLREADLGNDLRARLAQRRIYSIDAWQLVKEQFQARNVDPRLTRHHDWAARALLDAQPEAGYARVPSGFLDAETAWRHLFETLVGTRRGARDPEALLTWALDGAGAGRLNALPDAVRTGLAEAAASSPRGRWTSSSPGAPVSGWSGSATTSPGSTRPARPSSATPPAPPAGGRSPDCGRTRRSAS